MRLGSGDTGRFEPQITAAACAVVVMCVVLSGCAGAGTTRQSRHVGNADRCPHRNAYCPVAGPGVAWPGRPADSPSGRFELRVLPTGSDEQANGDWRFVVIDKATGAAVLGPSPGLDGGFGLIVMWDQREPETVWASRPVVTRWRPNPREWIGGPPTPREPPPAEVTRTVASDRD